MFVEFINDNARYIAWIAVVWAVFYVIYIVMVVVNNKQVAKAGGASVAAPVVVVPAAAEPKAEGLLGNRHNDGALSRTAFGY